MESTVIFQDGMDNDPADFTNLQNFAQTALDHVVTDTVTGERKYAGFDAAITGSAEVTVLAGRLYSDGARYGRNTDFVIDFTTKLPVASKKIATVVIWGTDVETASTQREFLINEESGASEPRTVAMELARVANIGVSYGAESPDPVPPTLDAGVLAVVQVLLSPVGVTSVTMLVDNRVVSNKGLDARLGVVEAFKDEAAPQIVSLGSDLAKIAEATKATTSTDITARILTRLATLEAKDGIPAAATDSAADFFLTTADSEITDGNFQALVSEGVRFADEGVNQTALSIFNPLNPNAKVVGGVIFPTYTRSLRQTVGPQTGEAQISAYSYQTHQMVQKTMTRTRLRYGERYVNLPDTTAYWLSGRLDLVSYTFSKDGEVFNLRDQVIMPGYVIVRQPYYWYDTVEETYWDNVTVDHAVPGAQIAETFLNANDMWLDAVGLTFTRLAATGTANLAICEVGSNGAPDLSKVISIQTVARADMVLNAETVVGIQPTFLQGGKRYAIVLTTGADHWVATTAGENFAQGTFFYVLDGAYQQGDGTRDLCFSLFAAKFSQSRVIIDMNALTLNGGMTSIDILAESVAPGSTTLTAEIQVGGVWYPLKTDEDLSILGTVGNLPPLVPLRFVFTGTPDVMPAIKVADSRVLVSRPRLTVTHISKVRTLPASSTAIRVIGKLAAFSATYNTAAAKLLTGVGYATSTAASSYSDKALTDGSIERTWVFNLGAGVTSYKIRLEGTATTALKTFVFSLRKDWAQ